MITIMQIHLNEPPGDILLFLTGIYSDNLSRSAILYSIILVLNQCIIKHGILVCNHSGLLTIITGRPRNKLDKLTEFLCFLFHVCL